MEVSCYVVCIYGEILYKHICIYIYTFIYTLMSKYVHIPQHIQYLVVLQRMDWNLPQCGGGVKSEVKN